MRRPCIIILGLAVLAGGYPIRPLCSSTNGEVDFVWDENIDMDGFYMGFSTQGVVLMCRYFYDGLYECTAENTKALCNQPALARLQRSGVDIFFF